MAVLPGPLNESIPSLLGPQDETVAEIYEHRAGDRFVVLDVSDPENIAQFVDDSRIELIIDHHAGYEDYWQDKKVPTQIEVIGAVCTQVFEYWQQAGLLSQMRPKTAQLLSAGILDNTLNFTAAITDNRDHVAYRALLEHASLDKLWPAIYFGACQEALMSDLSLGLKNDTKRAELAGFSGMLSIGQLVLWDAQPAMEQVELLRNSMTSAEPWFINVVSISEGRNYVICEDVVLQALLVQLLKAEFNDAIMTTNRLWLRKEILQSSIDRHGV